MLGLRLGLRPQNSGLGFAFGGLVLECCDRGLLGQVLALALADAVKLRCINSNIKFNYDCPSLSSSSVTVHHRYRGCEYLRAS